MIGSGVGWTRLWKPMPRLYVESVLPEADMHASKMVRSHNRAGLGALE
jgi:hypothetical protein